jgi:iron(III) transport system permease protein
VPNALGVVSYPRELADRFNAEYDFADAARMAVPLLLAALPLASLNLRMLAKVEFAPEEGAIPRRLPGGRWAAPVAAACAIAIGVGVVAPLGSLAAYSTRGAVYARVWQEAIDPLSNSGWLGGATIALTLGISLVITRRPPAIDALVSLPYAFPGSLVAIAVIAMLNRPGILGEIYGTSAPLLWAYVVLFFPFAHRAMAPGWRRVDRELMDEALLAGAGNWTRFRVVAWPAIAPYAAVGAALAFLLSAREMDATSLLRVPGIQTLAFKIQDYLHFYPVPNVAALCLILVLAQFVALGAVAALIAMRKGPRA